MYPPASGVREALHGTRCALRGGLTPFTYAASLREPATPPPELDIDNVADGYETKLKWNKPGDWIWSDQPAHEPLIDIEQFEAVQARIAAQAGHGPRLPCENLTYLRQDAILPKLDAWLATAFAPHNLAATVQAMAAASADADERNADATGADAAREQLDACNLKLTRYRALLDEGTGPAIVAGWIREVEAERLALQARLRTGTRRTAMTADEITTIVTALGDMIDVLARAEPADKIKIYTRLGLRMTHDINTNAIDVTTHPLRHDDLGLDPHVRKSGVRGAIDTLCTRGHSPIWGKFPTDLPFHPVDFTMESPRSL